MFNMFGLYDDIVLTYAFIYELASEWLAIKKTTYVDSTELWND